MNIVTKNFLVTRDLDVLSEMAKLDLAGVVLSITTLDGELARTMEPRTSTPERRLDAIARLAAAGVPVGVFVAPVIPGLNDQEIPAILAAAADRGAQFASMQIVRLPLSVEPIFLDWLDRERPLQKDRIVAHLRDVRGGKLSESAFGARMKGTGVQAELIRKMFDVAAKRAGLNKKTWRVSVEHFRRNASQFDLFVQ